MRLKWSRSMKKAATSFPLAPCLLKRLRQALLVGQPVRQSGQAVVVGQGPDLLQHLRVGQRDGDLIRQPPELEPLVLPGHVAGAVTDGEDADELAPEPERQHDHGPRVEPQQRRQVRRRRLGTGVEHEQSGPSSRSWTCSE